MQKKNKSMDYLKYFPRIEPTDFRTEHKILVTDEVRDWIRMQLNSGSLARLFADRIVVSTYYDTEDLTCWRDSEEGMVPRFKLRKRCYQENSSYSESKFEFKATLAEGRVKLITDSGFAHMFALNPVATVSYKRSYFSFGDSRLTFDREILYRSYVGIGQAREENSVLEIKHPRTAYGRKIKELAYFRDTRFSKYSNAIEKLGLGLAAGG